MQGIIGQDRAVRSLGFGLDMDNEGYNIYLAGSFGTGKTTLARKMLDEKALNKQVPPDWCYVNNFNNMESPRALQISAGKGQEFKKDVTVNMDMVIKLIVKAFEGEEFELQKSAIVSRFVEETNQIYLHLEEEARSYGFTISRTQSGVNSIPLKDGENMSQEAYMAMPEDERTELMNKSSIVQDKINESFRQYKEIEKIVKEKIKELELDTARIVAMPNFEGLYEKYKSYPEILSYLQQMHQDMLDNLDMFRTSEDDSPLSLLRRMDKRAMLRRYQVNLIVDNSSLEHAPVIFETNPSYSNLFGQIEFESEFGVLTTDFSRIKPGAIHKANGGYLVLHVYDIIKNFYVWDKLKRIIKNKEIVVESINKTFGLGTSETLQPETIPVDIKIVLIGEPLYYYLLYAHDEEFQKLFKIRADFDMDMNRTQRHIKDYARFISSVCYSEKLRHFDPAAVARVVDYGSRMADDQGKLTTLFNKLVEIIYEANCWAGYGRASVVNGDHVRQAIEDKQYRSATMEEKLQEYIEQGTLMINISGSKIGELNGLAVYQMGDYQFGKPVRITAKTFMGEKGLVNIEREIHLSGSIHSKGVLTLNGYLGSQYAQDKPLSLSASLTIEQSYSGIEGDSASSAELYALLSSLAEVPLQQGIAVTGSVNQSGEIQAVGGVNQKIEGFFRVCKDRGLNGQQGVIIPRQNVANLMLNEEVITAVKNKLFTIWAVHHVNEGIEILTGIPAGKDGEASDFTPGSIHYLVNKKLSQWSHKGKYSYGVGAGPVSRNSGLRRRSRR
ncbi:MAG: ATP-dependent protease [Firmicutes bacterium HGW-Firmicutes-15]|nr:MAG: ATP-dependent protease [Firmicutes bacterium HGW-Firmicutes-15]